MPFVLLILAAVAVLSVLACRHAARRYQQAMASGARKQAPGVFTGAEIAQRFLQCEDAPAVEIAPHQGVVTDYFDPARRRLFLSRRVGETTTLSAWAVALHEAAHALQTQDAGGDLRWRQSVIRMNRYAPTLIALVLAATTVLKVTQPRLAILIFAAVWIALFLLNLGTLTIEWNANLRLRRFLDRELDGYPEEREELDRLLAAVATREIGDLVNSPRYFFLSALPGTSKIRPTEKKH